MSRRVGLWMFSYCLVMGCRGADEPAPAPDEGPQQPKVDPTTAKAVSTSNDWSYDVTAHNLAQGILDISAKQAEECAAKPEREDCKNVPEPPPFTGSMECRGIELPGFEPDPHPKNRQALTNTRIFFTDDPRYTTGDLPNLTIQFHFESWTYVDTDVFGQIEVNIRGDYNSVWDLDVDADCGLPVTKVYSHVDRRTFDIDISKVAEDVEDLCKEGIAAYTEAQLDHQFQFQLGLFNGHPPDIPVIIRKDCAGFESIEPLTPRQTLAMGVQGQKTARVTMRNTGTVAWKPGSAYDVGLGLVGPGQVSQDSPCWDLAKPARWFVGEEVAPDSEYTFDVPLTATGQAGVTTCEFQMVRGKDSSNNQNHWFGPSVRVDVISQPPLSAG